MNKLRLALIGLLLFSTAPLPAAVPALPSFPPLTFHPPKPERTVLDNGLVVYLLEDHELPLIKVNTITRAGDQLEPADRVGQGDIFSEVLTEGGSTSHPPEEIEKILDRRAAGISFSNGTEAAQGSMSCRRDDFDEIFGLFTDLLQHPAFRKDFIELARGKALEGLRRINDEPEDVARREFRRAVYGQDHPYARIASPETLKAIKRDDLIAWHQKYYHPNATEIAISGDFDRSAMIAKVKKALGAWPKVDVVYPPIAPPAPAAGPRVLYIQRAVNQSQIRIGTYGLARHNPDHFAWEVFNELWGGSATSELFRTVRTKQGLAYAVGSAFSEPAEAGLIVAVCQTRGPETIAAAQSILSISREARSAPFGQERVREAQEAITNRFVENYTSSAQIASEVMSDDFFGFPADYLDTYTQHIRTVSAQDLRRVGEKYLHPDQSTILIVGDLSTFSKPISTLGKPQAITPVDYSEDHP